MRGLPEDDEREKRERQEVGRRKEATPVMVDLPAWRVRGGGAGDDVAVHHRCRREVFVQNGEGWLNCYRSSSHANIVYLAATDRPSAPGPRSFRSPPSPPPPASPFVARCCRRITRLCVISLMEIPAAFRITDSDGSAVFVRSIG